ncbi:WD40 repeat domain-containing protein [Chamaesiphon sp. OTE_20_metabat_361]|uniref:WD40 repeat domain-containing protein n=1 Tax=Chamaesiphon sp. OTE_20_metabat_361 TaxID=2964689 RepID=UPI00286A9760|nr:WD40 repeat domain-containing protein [Chamaesiphon sp. OTE_20_metabat_361]
MSNFHWLDLSEYLAIAAAVVGTIAAATSLNWMYALAPILLSLILSAINRWRLQQNLRLHERTLERKLDRELQQQGEVLQQEIAQARSFATALVKQTMAAKKTDPAVIAATDRQEVAILAQKFDTHKQLMLSMQEHVTGVEGSLKDVVDLLEGTALTERVKYLERHLTQVSQQLGLEPIDLDRMGASLPLETGAPQRTNADLVDTESPIDIKSLLEMISEDLSSGLMADNPSGELSGDLWAKPVWNLQQTIAAHSDWVRCLSFTPDGTNLVSGSFDKTIKLWQLATGTALQTLRDHQKGVFAIAVSADGKLLASGSWDELIKLWNLETGTLLENLTQHQASVRSLAISPDSQTLISGSFDCTIVLWNLPDGKVATTLTDTEPIAAIALSTDGRILASTGDNGTVKIWSLASGLAIAQSSGNQHCIGSLAIDPDGQTIAAGTVNGYIVLWQLHQRDRAAPQIELMQTIKAHAGQINACLFSPDGQYLITGSVDGKAKVWYRGADRRFGDKARSILKGDPGRSVMSVAIAPHSRLIAIGGADGTIQLWERI